MATYKKLVYCDFEFLKKLRSSNSHFSPFASGDAMMFWINALRFVCKSNIQLNADIQTFNKIAKRKDGDTLFELWKRVANGECEIHFLEEHNVKFVENKICMDDALQCAYLIKEKKAVAQHYAKNLGVVAISVDSWRDNTSAKQLEFLFKDSGCEIPKSERKSWADILRSREYQLFNCNAMIITDNYLLKDPISIQKNLYPILDELLPQTLSEGRIFHLTIVAADRNQERYASVYTELEKKISAIRPNLSISIEMYVEYGIGSLHDRAIITNNTKVEVPGGFDLINKSGKTTKETKVSILYPGIQSFSDSCDGTYTRLLDNCRQIIRKIRNGNGGKFWSTYNDDEINRLLS